MEFINTYTYTRAQALQDKQQFNTDDLVKGLAKEAGIKYTVFITESVKSIIDESLNYGCNDLTGVLWDVFTMFRLAAKNANTSLISFKVWINWKKDKPKEFKLYADIGCTDFNNPEPAITIMTSNDL